MLFAQSTSCRHIKYVRHLLSPHRGNFVIDTLTRYAGCGETPDVRVYRDERRKYDADRQISFVGGVYIACVRQHHAVNEYLLARIKTAQMQSRPAITLENLLFIAVEQ
jgi:hypothetical protein